VSRYRVLVAVTSHHVIDVEAGSESEALGLEVDDLIADAPECADLDVASARVISADVVDDRTHDEDGERRERYHRDGPCEWEGPQ
jgi:hypothetical protein